jgi:hypothetical protein
MVSLEISGNRDRFGSITQGDNWISEAVREKVGKSYAFLEDIVRVEICCHNGHNEVNICQLLDAAALR